MLHKFTALFLSIFCTVIFFSTKSFAQPIKVTHRPHKVEAYVGHAFIKKCIGTNEFPTPEVTTPTIDVTEDKENSSRLFNIQFNGKDLNPILRVNSKKIVLEKTSDQRGYFITLSKSAKEKVVKLVFELHNKENESILHLLKITGNKAVLAMYPNNEQRQRLCIRDQMWIGFGIPFIKNTQYNYNSTLNADLESTTENSSSLINIEYRKTLNSKLSINLSYRNAEPKVKTSSTIALVNDKQKWQTFDTSLVWRNINWSRETQNSLIYPYLKIGYQHQVLPVFHITNTGAAKSLNLIQHAAVAGLGINIFNKNDFLFESGLNLKWPVLEDAKSELSLDGYIGVSKVLQGNLSLGLNLTAARERRTFKTSEAGFENTGNLDFTAATLDLRLGLVF